MPCPNAGGEHWRVSVPEELSHTPQGGRELREGGTAREVEVQHEGQGAQGRRQSPQALAPEQVQPLEGGQAAEDVRQPRQLGALRQYKGPQAAWQHTQAWDEGFVGAVPVGCTIDCKGMRWLCSSCCACCSDAWPVGCDGWWWGWWGWG